MRHDHANRVDSYAVYIAILLFYLVFAYFMYPETKHRTIEEVSVLFDRPRVVAVQEPPVPVFDIEGSVMEKAERCVEEKAVQKGGVCSHREGL